MSRILMLVSIILKGQIRNYELKNKTQAEDCGYFLTFLLSPQGRGWDMEELNSEIEASKDT
ncbi:MAG: hypothetical protein AABZ11_02915 [Nitrospinota bacterium]